ncbi:MAG: hypothetical protein ACJ8G3_21770 [Burkholderiaceae bacterium]
MPPQPWDRPDQHRKQASQATGVGGIAVTAPDPISVDAADGDLGAAMALKDA